MNNPESFESWCKSQFLICPEDEGWKAWAHQELKISELERHIALAEKVVEAFMTPASHVPQAGMLSMDERQKLIEEALANYNAAKKENFK